MTAQQSAPTRELRCVLVANRGEIARRVFATARAMGLRTVAVHSDADRDAPFVAEADLAVRLPGTSPTDTYLRGDLIVAAARRAGADCIHPGYGFLSESAAFARQVSDAGLVFIGPSPEAVEAMGSKLAAKAMMAAAGVPVLPSIDTTGLSADALVTAADEVGYPVLVKACFGGGGRGMREVHEPALLLDAVEGARREATSAFGDGTVFLERLVVRPRHVEVQVFGDTHGNVVPLFERECSVQRRHQKVLEEAPSPAVDAGLRARLQQAAVTAARTLDYVGAGTVEFLLTPGGEFFFLEVNTRLQVEHPVTEAVTGLDLVRLQFDVAAGHPLPPDVLSPTLRGHAIEVRLYAEDPAQDWLPQAGLLADFDVPADVEFANAAGPFVRVDSGVAPGSEVGIHYDPMLAKVIAWAPTRAAAAQSLAGALSRARLHGLQTNRDLLVNVLRSPAFLAGDTDTSFFAQHGLTQLARSPLTDPDRHLHALAAALAGAFVRRAGARVLAELPSGWRNNPTQLQRTDFNGLPVRYRLEGAAVTAEVDGAPLQAQVRRVSQAAPGRVQLTLEHDGVEVPLHVHVVPDLPRARSADETGATAYVDSSAGSSVLVERARFPSPSAAVVPGSLTATMPGTVVRVAAEVGQLVAAGQLLVVLEAMKMEHPLTAGQDGVVSAVHVAAGEQVETGQVLALVEPAPVVED